MLHHSQNQNQNQHHQNQQPASGRSRLRSNGIAKYSALLENIQLQLLSGDGGDDEPSEQIHSNIQPELDPDFVFKLYQSAGSGAAATGAHRTLESVAIDGEAPFHSEDDSQQALDHDDVLGDMQLDDIDDLGDLNNLDVHDASSPEMPALRSSNFTASNDRPFFESQDFSSIAVENRKAVTFADTIQERTISSAGYEKMHGDHQDQPDRLFDNLVDTQAPTFSFDIPDLAGNGSDDDVAELDGDDERGDAIGESKQNKEALPRITLSVKDPFISQEPTPTQKQFEIKSPFKNTIFGAFQGRHSVNDTFDTLALRPENHQQVSENKPDGATDEPSGPGQQPDRLESMGVDLSTTLEPIMESTAILHSASQDQLESCDQRAETLVPSSMELSTFESVPAKEYDSGDELPDDDFIELKRGKLSILGSDAEPRSQSPLSDKSVHDDDSILMNLGPDGRSLSHSGQNGGASASILNSSAVEDSGPLLSDDLMTTPHNNRTISSHDVDFMSPGSFFAQKSCNLGSLGGQVSSENRPSWYTPKIDACGRTIDPIGATPGSREEKSNDHEDTSVSMRRVRTSDDDSPSRELENRNPDRTPTWSVQVNPHDAPGDTENETIAKAAETTDAAEYESPTAIKIVDESNRLLSPPQTTGRMPTESILLPPRPMVAPRLPATELQDTKSPARNIFETKPSLSSAALTTASTDALVSASKRVATQAIISQYLDRQMQTQFRSSGSSRQPPSPDKHLSESILESVGSMSLSQLASPCASPDISHADTAAVSERHLADAQSIPLISSISSVTSSDFEQRCDRGMQTIIIPPLRHSASIFGTSGKKTGSTVHIAFGLVSYRHTSISHLNVQNDSGREISWVIDPIGPVYMEASVALRESISPRVAKLEASGSSNPKSLGTKPLRHKIPNLIFSFAQSSGKLDSGQSVIINLAFQPLSSGIYAQAFQLKA
eukprot:jgi/Hompol1/5181/HPOL_001915-RA